MSAPPARERSEASDNLVSLTLDDDDIFRAALIFARARDDAERRHAECEAWRGASRRIWREPQPSAVLHRRMIARRRARIARGWLITQALFDWLPHGRGH
ncbi:hypothetical protein IYW40_04650 [Methylocystis sp. H4A]|uniref:hypothetical protein n=1 Tax=Methylocystis sp. H4A TaxID=2785788 RepID=UPI0018C28EE7|nr:hypothetical protein [Methylocystis sp. H4A]MBG0800783.1 hypothetical protein [Methylocystis sp. H4A]